MSLRHALGATFRTRPQRSLLGVGYGAILQRPLSQTVARVSPSITNSIYKSCSCRRSYNSKTPPATGSQPPAKKSDPLHILFCGSDEFSCASLEALHREHVENPGLVRSIDVVVRPGKRTGRGYKVIRDPPIRGLATKLGLPIHERDTFTGWSPLPTTNLIIAVSFGLFVPPRLLRSAKYGGLNVHPSLLPDLRGPAPLHHALLARRRYAGVSLQTLDDRTFDHGLVLSQTPVVDAADGSTALPVPDACSVPQLLGLVTPVAADMLVRGLRDGVHVPPLEDRGWRPVSLGSDSNISNSSSSSSSSSSDATSTSTSTSPERESESESGALQLRHAPKITKADRQLLGRHTTGDGETVLLRQRVIGPLWFWAQTLDGRGRERVIVEEVERAAAACSDHDVLGSPSPNQEADDAAGSHPDVVTGIGRLPAPGIKEEGRDSGPDSGNADVVGEDDPLTRKLEGDTPRLRLWARAGDREAVYVGNARIVLIKISGDKKPRPALPALLRFFGYNADF